LKGERAELQTAEGGRLRNTIKVAWVALLACLQGSVWASDFIDTRLTFAFANDNVLVKPGETIPNNPGSHIGADAQNTQFYDNFNTRFTGFETLSHLALYKKAPAFFRGLITEASLTILVLERPSGGITLRDNSSYIRIAYTPPSWAPNENIAIIGFPVSADRFRLGYAWRISWGGNGAFTQRAVLDGVPGVKIQITRDHWYAFAGVKTGLIFNDLILEKEAVYGFLGGAGVDVLPTLRLEANGGYFQKGLVPGLAVQGIRAPVNALGISSEAVWHVGAPVGTSIDLRLYRNDPELFYRFFAPEVYPGGLSYSVSFEGSQLVQTLENPDVSGATSPQGATAFALQARFKYDFTRWHVLGLYRTVSFIQFEVPGVPPYKNFPAGTKLQPEMFIAAGVDHHLPDLHLTPGIVVGLQQPASYTSPDVQIGGNNPPPSLTGNRTVVVRDVNQFSILPSGRSATWIFSAKTTFRWDLSDSVAAIGELYYVRDANQTIFKDDLSGISEPTFQQHHQLGFNIVMQARF
jgi:hypothetical protein